MTGLATGMRLFVHFNILREVGLVAYRIIGLAYYAADRGNGS